jgi:hypothetical protein
MQDITFNVRQNQENRGKMPVRGKIVMYEAEEVEAENKKKMMMMQRIMSMKENQ